MPEGFEKGDKREFGGGGRPPPVEWGPAKWILRGHPGPKARRTDPEMFLVIFSDC